MISRSVNVFSVLCLLASSAIAQWDGWPVSSSSTWYSVEDLHYVPQLYSSIVERCQAVGVAEPVIVNSWSVQAGFSNPIVATNSTTGLIATNPIPKYMTVSTSNQWGAVSYIYTNYDGAVESGVFYPYVKQGDIAALDAKVDVLIPKFCVTNELVAGNFGSWFAKTSLPSAFPMETKGGLFYRQNIGYWTNLTVDAHGLTNGTVAYYTRWPAQATNEWTLGSVTYGTNGWAFSRINDLDLRLYDQSVRPVLRYIPGSTSTAAFPSITFNLSGTALRFSDQVATSAVESVSMVSTGEVQLTIPWKVISGISVTGTPVTNGDSFVIAYYTPFTLYGDMPFRLFAQDLNERQRIINALLISPTTYAYTNQNRYVTPVRYYWGKGESSVSWAAAKSAAEADFQSRALTVEATLTTRTIGSSVGFAGSSAGQFTIYPKWTAVKMAGTWAITNFMAKAIARESQVYFISRPFGFISKMVPSSTYHYEHKSFVDQWVTQPAQTNIIIPENYDLIQNQSAQYAWYAGTNLLNVEFGAVDIPSADWCNEPSTPGDYNYQHQAKGFAFGVSDYSLYPFFCAELWDFKYK